MKKIFYIALLLLFSSSITYAQPTNPVLNPWTYSLGYDRGLVDGVELIDDFFSSNPSAGQYCGTVEVEPTGTIGETTEPTTIYSCTLYSKIKARNDFLASSHYSIRMTWLYEARQTLPQGTTTEYWDGVIGGVMESANNLDNYPNN